MPAVQRYYHGDLCVGDGGSLGVTFRDMLCGGFPPWTMRLGRRDSYLCPPVVKLWLILVPINDRLVCDIYRHKETIQAPGPSISSSTRSP